MSTLYLTTEIQNKLGAVISARKDWKEQEVPHFYWKKVDSYKIEFKSKSFVIYH